MVDAAQAPYPPHQRLMGRRIYVPNTTKTRMSLIQSVRYYRDEYTVERGFHRFKRGSLPVSLLKIPKNIDDHLSFDCELMKKSNQLQLISI